MDKNATTRRRERALNAMRAAGPLCAFNNVRILSRTIEREYDAAFAPAGLSASQVALLWTILGSEPVALNDLAALYRSDQTTVSRIVERARRLGLVEVTRSPRDRRCRVVRLSDSGRRRLAGVLPQWRRAQLRLEHRYPRIVDGLLGLVRRNGLRAPAKVGPATVRQRPRRA